MALREMLAGLFSVVGLGAAFAAPMAEVGPEALKDTKSFREILAGAHGKPVHIVYVHGIASDSAGLSEIFQKKLRAKMPELKAAGEPVVERNHRLAISPKPDFKFMTDPIWTDETWATGAPFVNRYTYNVGGHPLLIVDEVNWWPLAVPLKCRALVAPEARLGGLDTHHLYLCAGLADDGTTKLGAPYQSWLNEKEINDALKAKRPIGGAAWANGAVKRGLMNWGLSDAVIALGPMQTYFRATIDKAFEYAATDSRTGGAADDEYVLIAESLGSFITLDAWHTGGATHDLLQRTAYIYLFANQFALLELGRLGQDNGYVPSHGLVNPPVTGVGQSPLDALSAWAEGQDSAEHSMPGLSGTYPLSARPNPKQIIAFSDPTDALTFLVPGIDKVKVTNIMDRNGFDFLHIAADPLTAHVGHHSNDKVIDVMIDGAKALK